MDEQSEEQYPYPGARGRAAASSAAVHARRGDWRGRSRRNGVEAPSTRQQGAQGTGAKASTRQGVPSSWRQMEMHTLERFVKERRLLRLVHLGRFRLAALSDVRAGHGRDLVHRVAQAAFGAEQRTRALHSCVHSCSSGSSCSCIWLRAVPHTTSYPDLSHILAYRKK